MCSLGCSLCQGVKSFRYIQLGFPSTFLGLWKALCYPSYLSLSLQARLWSDSTIQCFARTTPSSPCQNDPRNFPPVVWQCQQWGNSTFPASVGIRCVRIINVSATENLRLRVRPRSFWVKLKDSENLGVDTSTTLRARHLFYLELYQVLPYLAVKGMRCFIYL